MIKNELSNIADIAFDAINAIGADGAEFTISRGRTDELNVDAGEFSLFRTTFNASLSARVLIGGAKGVAVTNNLERGAIELALGQAADAAKSAEPDDAEYIAEGVGEHEFNIGAESECDPDAIYGQLKEYLDDARRLFPKMVPFQNVSKFTSTNSLYANTNGTRVYTNSASYNHDVTFCARDGERVSSLNGTGFTEKIPGAPFLDKAELKRLLSESERQIETTPIDGKFIGAVLMSPDCLMEMIYNIIGNCVSDTPLIAGNSPWLKKLGETVADSRLNVSFDPFDPRVTCGARVTGDGHLTRRHDIIRGGVLTGWALSQYGAKKTGLERAGNLSGNLIIAAGDQTFDEIVAGIGHGILMNRFSGGYPALNGDFSGIAKNSFLIKDGKICEAVNETMVSGNLLDMLKNITGLGSVAVSDGNGAAPFAAFGGVTISGK